MTLSAGQAAPPSGEVSFYFNGPSTAVYDLTGAYDISQDLLGAGGATTTVTLYGLPIQQDAQGRLRGAGLVLVGIGNDFVGANYRASGKVSGGGSSINRVTLSLRLRGEGVVGGLETRFNISIRYNLEVTPTGLTGSARGSASFSRLGDGRIDSFVSDVPLPEGVDGSWGAQLNILPLHKLTGSGSVVLSNGRTIQGNVRGSYSANQALSRLKFSGTFGSRGNKLQLTVPDGALQPEHVSGRLLGQKVLQ